MGEIMVNTQVLSWRKESTFGTDPITDANTAIYYFMKAQRSLGDFPALQTSLFPYYNNSNQVQELVRHSQTVTANLAGIPVNALPFYWALGNSSNSGAGAVKTHTITPVNTLPSITSRKESVSHYEHMTGIYLQSLNYRHNFEQGPNSFPIMVMGLAGLKPVDPKTDAPSTKAAMTPVYPGSDSSHWRKDSGFLLKYDNAAQTPVSLETQVLDYNLQITNIMSYAYDRQTSITQPVDLYNGQQIVVLDLTVLADSTSKRLMSDFYDDVRTSATTTYDFKYYAQKPTTTHNIQIDTKAMTVKQVIQNDANYLGEERSVYRLTAMCPATATNMIVTAKDELHDADFYGV